MISRRATFRAFIAFGVALAPIVALADDMGIQLKGDAIGKALVGHEMIAVAPNGSTWSGIYRTDGTTTWSNGSSGTWRVDGDRFCNSSPGDNKEYCRIVYEVGNKKYQLVRPDGSKGAVLIAK
jgi:hypothetical protein